MIMMSPIPSISEIVRQALTTGCLTLKAEDELLVRLRNKYGLEDLEAFIELQEAVIIGQVTQESRELMLAGSY